MISIIVPVYNSTETLRVCVDSIRGQTYTDWELILIDDGSEDDSFSICKKYAEMDSRIKAFRYEHSGQAAARNHALRIAAGDFIAFSDADDYTEPEMMRQLYRSAVVHNADLVICDFTADGFENDFFSHFQNPGPKRLASLQRESRCQEEWLMKDNVFLWNKLFRKRLFDGLSFEEGHHYEDAVIMQKLFCRAGRISYVDNQLYHYLYHAGSVNGSVNFTKVRDCFRSYRKRIAFAGKSGWHKDVRHLAIAYLYQAYAFEHLAKDCADCDRIRLFIRKEIKRDYMDKKLVRQIPLWGRIRCCLYVRGIN